MRNSLLAVLAILGTVIGSGFISGKEVGVFFSRFGIMSLPSIFVAFLLFFFLFKVILNSGEQAMLRMKNSKVLFLLNLIICLIFSSAMFAGISNLLIFDKKIVNLCLFFLILALSFIVYKFGMGSLNKINAILVPLMIVVFVGALCSKISFQSIKLDSFSYSWLSFIYGILYVILNTANGGVLIASLGKKLTNRQKTQVAFFSALALFVILLIANLVLLLNPTSIVYAMPLASIFSASMHMVMTFVIFIGCLTSLLTLVFTLSSSMRGLCKNEFLIFFTSVILPLCISLLGFNFIVEYLYPLASVLGIYLLGDLFLIPLFKRAYKKVHSAGKNT